MPDLVRAFDTLYALVFLCARPHPSRDRRARQTPTRYLRINPLEIVRFVLPYGANRPIVIITVTPASICAGVGNAPGPDAKGCRPPTSSIHGDFAALGLALTLRPNLTTGRRAEPRPFRDANVAKPNRSTSEHRPHSDRGRGKSPQNSLKICPDHPRENMSRHEHADRRYGTEIWTAGSGGVKDQNIFRYERFFPPHPSPSEAFPPTYGYWRTLTSCRFLIVRSRETWADGIARRTVNFWTLYQWSSCSRCNSICPRGILLRCIQFFIHPKLSGEKFYKLDGRFHSTPKKPSTGLFKMM